MTTTTSTSRRSSSSRRGVQIRCSTRADGNFHATHEPAADLDVRRRRFVDLPWTMLDQCHGIGVVRVEHPGAADRQPGDIAITSQSGAVLGCWVADCAPLVLVGERSEFAVVHAGWRGLAAGVIDAAVRVFDEPVVEAFLGPAIGPCCYEFGADDLAAVAAGVGATIADIAGRTTPGALALDVPAAVAAACRRHGIEVRPVGVDQACTGCSFDGYSHRARRDPQRHVVAAWQRPEAIR